jgi:hypothetical protein
MARSSRQSRAIIRAVASSVLSLCITPFGSPVVPEVKGGYITWLASRLGCRLMSQSRFGPLGVGVDA